MNDLEEKFQCRFFPLFMRRTEGVGASLPELYLHELSLGDFELELRGLLGGAAPLSASSIVRLRTEWQMRYDTWKRRDRSDLEVVYPRAGGVYATAGVEARLATHGDLLHLSPKSTGRTFVRPTLRT